MKLRTIASVECGARQGWRIQVRGGLAKRHAYVNLQVPRMIRPLVTVAENDRRSNHGADCKQLARATGEEKKERNKGGPMIR
jgi:hypothetical protein